MNFNSHFDLVGRHAFLSASNYHWVNYTDDKLDIVFRNNLAAARGTALHEFAHQAITLGIKLARSKKTLNMYINDAIGYRMITEQILYYSDNCFGTCDAISFRKNVLRIHDLKTGVTRTSMIQLEVYAALFCLEYGVKPGSIEIELRIYKDDDVEVHVPEIESILQIMNTIIAFDKRIEKIRLESI